MDPWSLISAAVGLVGVAQAAIWGLSSNFGKSKTNKRNSDALPRLTIPDGQTAFPDFDICFVHGLAGNSDSTWTWDSKDETILWPMDYLSRETRLPNSTKPFPKARVMFYEYDTDVHSLAWLTARTLYYHANHLLEKLTKQRGDNDRPLLFVAHSLGGLLVKNALVFSHRESNKEPEIGEEDSLDLGEVYRATFGIISFGVPQTFSKNPPLKELVSSLCFNDRPSMPVFEDVRGDRWKRDVDTLELRSKEYNHYPLAMEIPELFCFESAKNVNPISTFKMTAPPQSLGYISPLSSCLPIERNHFDLPKFRTRDTVYLELCKRIELFYDNAQDLLGERHNRRKGAGRKQEEPCIPSAVFQGSQFVVNSQLPQRIQFVRVNSKSRAKLLEEVNDRLKENRFAVLTGPLGSGKTSLAVEYAHRHKDCYSSVFWLDARSERTLESSFVKIAHELQAHYSSSTNAMEMPAELAKDLQKLHRVRVGKEQVPIRNIDRKSMVLTVLDWFRSPGNKEWLLIYDDVEHSSAPFLQNFLPAMKTIKSKRGYVLITSRSDYSNPSEFSEHQIELSYSNSNSFLQIPRAFGSKPGQESNSVADMGGYFQDPIQVGHFHQEESVELLQRSFRTHRSNLIDVSKSATDASYFGPIVPSVGQESRYFKDLANTLQNNPLDVAHAGAFISAADSPNLIPNMLAGTLDQIAEIPSEFYFWYDACIMLGPGPIPIQLVQNHFHIDGIVMESSLKVLEAKGAIMRPGPSSENFEVLPDSLRYRRQCLMGERREAKKYAEIACNSAVGYLEYLSADANLDRPVAKESEEKTILEHIDTCLDHCRDYKDILCEWDILARLCENYGFYSQASIFYKAAQGQWFRNDVTEAPASQEQHSNESESDSVLMNAWLSANDPVRNQVLATYSNPADHLFKIILEIDTKKSRKLRSEVAAIRMQLSGIDFKDPRTQSKRSIPDSPDRDSGRQDGGNGGQPINPVKACMRILQEVEGRNEDRYISLKAEATQQIVRALKRRGDWLGAVRWNRSLISTLEILVGPNAEETMEAIQQMAEIRMSQSDFCGASPLLEQVRLRYENIYDESHRKNIEVVELLSRAYVEQGELTTARDLCRRMVDVRTRDLGEQHIETASAQARLAEVYARLESKTEAEEWYGRALRTAEMFGKDTSEFEEISKNRRKFLGKGESSSFCE